jgi:hypothetical protein
MHSPAHSAPHPADGRHQQALDADARVVHLLLGKAGVDDVHDAIDGQRRLCNVGGHHDLAALRAPGHGRRRRLRGPAATTAAAGARGCCGRHGAPTRGCAVLSSPDTQLRLTPTQPRHARHPHHPTPLTGSKMRCCCCGGSVEYRGSTLTGPALPPMLPHSLVILRHASSISSSPVRNSSTSPACVWVAWTLCGDVRGCAQVCAYEQQQGALERHWCRCRRGGGASCTHACGPPPPPHTHTPPPPHTHTSPDLCPPPPPPHTHPARAHRVARTRVSAPPCGWRPPGSRARAPACKRSPRGAAGQGPVRARGGGERGRQQWQQGWERQRSAQRCLLECSNLGASHPCSWPCT